MSKVFRFTIGGLGGLLPLIASLVAVDLTAIQSLIDSHGLTEGLCVGYAIRVTGLFALGGIMAALNNDVVNPLTLVQIGIAAPALVTSYLTGAVIQKKTAELGFISTAYAYQEARPSVIRVAGGFLGDVLTGIQPGLGVDSDKQNDSFGCSPGSANVSGSIASNCYTPPPPGINAPRYLTHPDVSQQGIMGNIMATLTENPNKKEYYNITFNWRGGTWTGSQIATVTFMDASLRPLQAVVIPIDRSGCFYGRGNLQANSGELTFDMDKATAIDVTLSEVSGRTEGAC